MAQRDNSGDAPEGVRLLDQVRRAVRLRYYSRRTEQAYCYWVRAYVRYHRLRHPQEMGEKEVAQFLSHLTIDRSVAPSTQNQALNALCFLYRHVLDQPLGHLSGTGLANARPITTAFTADEVQRVLARLRGVPWFVANTLYGSDLGLMECLRLRVGDVDLGRQEIAVCNGRGHRTRTTALPERMIPYARRMIERSRRYHQIDCAKGLGTVEPLTPLAYRHPGAVTELGRQYLLPSHKRSPSTRTGREIRRHVSPDWVLRAVHGAIAATGIAKAPGDDALARVFIEHLADGNRQLPGAHAGNVESD